MGRRGMGGMYTDSGVSLSLSPMFRPTLRLRTKLFLDPETPKL